MILPVVEEQAWFFVVRQGGVRAGRVRLWGEGAREFAQLLGITLPNSDAGSERKTVGLLSVEVIPSGVHITRV